MREQMAGTWVGTRWIPWPETPPIDVAFTFASDGSAQSACVSGGGDCSVLYFGEASRWQILDLTAEGVGLGRMEVDWAGVHTHQWGTLSGIEFSNDGQSLTFEFGTIPIVFVLRRVPN